jgi:ribose transport system substrate-binding protein
VLIAVHLGLIAGSIGGCSQRGADQAPPAASGPAGAPAEKLEIAVVPKGVAFDFWLAVKAGAEQAGKEEGATIFWNGPAKESETDKQIAILENFITRRVSAIVMAACDADALVDVVDRAVAAGIPVVVIDSGVNSDKPVSVLATDNEKAAEMAADFLAGQLGPGPAEIALVPFIKGAATSDQRERGFLNGLKKHPNLKLVATLYSQSQSDVAMRVTENMLAAHPNLKGIFAASEPGAIGCAEVLEARGLAGTVKLVAFDAATPEIRALDQGTIQALVVQNPFKMGYDGVKTAIRAVRGETVEKQQDTGVAVITKDTMTQPEMEKLLYPLAADRPLGTPGPGGS